MSVTIEDQNLGAVTAYGLAKTAGYTGTKSQYAALMASYGTVAQEVADTAAQIDTAVSEGLSDIETKKQEALADIPSDYTTLSGEVDQLDNEIPKRANPIFDTATGAIVTVTDGADDVAMKSLVCDIDPVQDLHGYANPWPTGGNANLLPPIEEYSYTSNGVTFTSNGKGRYKLSGTATGGSFSLTKSLTNESAPLASGDYMHFRNSEANGSVTVTLNDAESTMTYYGMSPASRIIAVPSANVGKKVTKINFYVGSGSTVNMTLDISIEKTNAVTDFTPYSNICPISGHTGVDVTKYGRNILPITKYATTNNVDSDGNITRNSATTWAWTYANCTLRQTIPAGTYRITVFLSSATTLTAPGFQVIDNANNTIVNKVSFTNVTKATATFTVTKETKIGVAFKLDENQSARCMIEGDTGSIPDAYEKPNLTTIPVTFPSEAGTVYGGYVDVVKGKLVVNKAVVDLGTLSWTKINGTSAVYDFFQSTLSVSPTPGTTNAICSNYVITNVLTVDSGVNNAVRITVSGDNVRVRDTSYTAAADFKTAMNGVMLVYEVLTPQTYDIDPVTVKTLLGINNVWNSTGDTTIEYPVDIKTYVDSVQSNLNTVADELDDAKSDITSVQTSVTALQSDVDNAEADIDAVEADVTQLKSDFDALVPTTVDLIPLAYAITPTYIQSAGVLSNSVNWRTFWLKRKDVGALSSIKMGASTTLTINEVAFYNTKTPSTTSFISGVQFTTASTINTLQNVEIPANTELILICGRNDQMSGSEIKGRDGQPFANRETIYDKLSDRFVMVGYSGVINPYDYVINTVEMYEYIATAGYDAIKGDIRITSDNALVMCHDAGFTLNTDGEIVSYNASDSTPIRSMTLAQVRELTFAQKTTGGDTMKVPTFEAYVRICKKYGKPLFVTLRDEYMNDILPLVFQTLDKYGVRNNTILNSLTHETLVAVREIDEDIAVIYTVNCLSNNISIPNVVDAATLGNSAFGFYGTSGGTVSDLEARVTANSANLQVIRDCGLKIYGAITRRGQSSLLLDNLFDGTQAVEYWE